MDYWDRLEMEPIASHSGSVTRVASGPIYWGLKEYPQSQGRLKFPTLTGEGCESFPMTAVITFADAGNGKTHYRAVALHRNAADRETHAQMGFEEGWGTCAAQLEELAQGLAAEA